MTIPVIDVFAGPGGLNEGFSRLGESDSRAVFETVASIEMEASAVNTLRLRSTYRDLLRTGKDLSIYYSYVRGETSFVEATQNPDFFAAYERSKLHVHQLELGKQTRDVSNGVVRQALEGAGVGLADPWVLIGGPPCQAYSIAGRSRRVNDVNFATDHKHFLYEEYLNLISEFAPPVFVMENVKGMISSATTGRKIFDVILSDLRNPRPDLEYDIYSLSSDKLPADLAPTDYIVRSEEYGVPQKRHRVILLGVRKDIVSSRPGTLEKVKQGQTIRDAISELPKIRSGLSKTKSDDWISWSNVRSQALQQVNSTAEMDRGKPFIPQRVKENPSSLRSWLADERLQGVIQHESRSHMSQDLQRYGFAASRALEAKTSPKLSDFPDELLPNHKNARSEAKHFVDRFRVQVWDQPGSTVVSHIAKDGHFYIHPDPEQMRSFTVREAARIQTFPDNYFFTGNRTQQFTQVGNAVPPLLANQIARVVANFFKSNS